MNFHIFQLTHHISVVQSARHCFSELEKKLNQRHYERPYSPTAQKSISAFLVDKAVLAIWKEYERRLSGTFKIDDHIHTKNESAKNFLRREIYVLGKHLIDFPPKNWSISDLPGKVRIKSSTRPHALENVFHALFMSLYEEDSQISRQERWLMARELQYAQKHNVPPELLCGFLYQSGPRAEIAMKLENNYIEPAFRTADFEDD